MDAKRATRTPLGPSPRSGIARQRGPLGLERSIWYDLTASNHEIYQFHHSHNSLSHLKLSHMDFLDDPAAFHGCRLIISDVTQDESPNELTNQKLSMKKQPNLTYSFTWLKAPIFPTQ